MRLAASPPAWALGCEEETWWSRLAQPALHAWAPAQQPLQLVEQPVQRPDPDPKALACYGLLVQERTVQGVSHEHVWLRFGADRPVRAVPVAFLTWGCAKLTALGKTALLLVWDNASWHGSQAVQQWLHEHNRQVKREGQGGRIVRCPLPSQSPWLTPLEAHWVHGKRAVVEPARLLTAAELVERVNTHFGCPYEKPLSIPQKVS
jgi:DDE superfamily endonuclease